MVFTQFDRDALIEALKRRNQNVRRIEVPGSGAEASSAFQSLSIDEWDEAMTGRVSGATREDIASRVINEQAEIMYADEIPPFDVTISFANEYGQKAVLEIYGLEILNEGTGFSIDSVTTEKACTFVARRVGYMKPIED